MTPSSPSPIKRMTANARQERAKDRPQAEALLAHVQRNMGLIKDAFFEIGLALTELNNNRMYLALGHATFADMLEARGLMSQAQANKLIAVATLLPREAAVRLGAEKSYALTRYAQASAPSGGLAGLLESGKVKGRSLDTVTLRELTELTRDVRGPRKTGKEDSRAEARSQARKAQSALRKAGMSMARVEAVGPHGVTFRVTLNAADLGRLVKKI